MEFISMTISTKIPSFTLYVGPRPLTPPCYLPNTPPSSVSPTVHTVSPAGRGVANDTVSSTDAGLGWGKDEAGASLSSPLSLPSVYTLLQLGLAGCWAHPFAAFDWQLEILFCATAQHEGQWGGLLLFRAVSYPFHLICILPLIRQER